MMDAGTAPAQKKAGPGLALCLIIIVVGIAVAAFGGTEGVKRIVHAANSPALITPADIHRHLAAGTYEIYVSESVLATISPSQVDVTGPDGLQIPVTETGSVTETITRNGQAYRAQVGFTVSTTGDYNVSVRGPQGVPFVLANSLGDLVRHAARWFALLGLGVLIVIVGIIVLIVGIARRSRSGRSTPQPVYQAAGYQPAAYQPAQSLPPPGWYPDPSIPGVSRWWDGTRWTDQTQAPH